MGIRRPRDDGQAEIDINFQDDTGSGYNLRQQLGRIEGYGMKNLEIDQESTWNPEAIQIHTVGTDNTCSTEISYVRFCCRPWLDSELSIPEERKFFF